MHAIRGNGVLQQVVSKTVLLFSILFFQQLHSASATHEQRQLGSTAAPYGFLEYLPAAYHNNPSTNYPVVIFLHGLGEQGNGTTELWGKISAHGPHKLIKDGSTLFDTNNCIVLSPQTPVWWNMSTLHNFFTYIRATYRIDPNRVYVTGLSMGGGGTWSYVSAHGDEITACVPICGAAGAGNATKFLTTPTWAFHSWGDGTVTRNNSIGWCNNIAGVVAGTGPINCMANYPHADGDTSKAASETKTAHYTKASGWVWDSGVTSSNLSQPKFTMYTDSSHNSWTRTYNNNTMWTWLFQQTRSTASAPVVQISSPSAGTNINAGDSITFIGSANDPEDGSLSGSALEWRSNLDGVLGSGTQVSSSSLRVGIHTISLSATDSDGRIGSTTRTVGVLFNGIFDVVIDFGASGGSTSGNYNNISSTSGSLANAIGVNGTQTSASVAISDAFEGMNSDGVVASDLYPSTAQQDTMFINPNGDNHAEITISGLSDNFEYDFTFFASRNAGNDRTTEYTINNQKVSLNAQNNTNQSISIVNISPNAQGMVIISIDVAAGSAYGYLGVLQIEAHAPNGNPSIPPAQTSHTQFTLKGQAEPHITLLKINAISVIPAGDGSFTINVPCTNNGGTYVLELYDGNGIVMQRDIELSNTAISSN